MAKSFLLSGMKKVRKTGLWRQLVSTPEIQVPACYAAQPGAGARHARRTTIVCAVRQLQGLQPKPVDAYARAIRTMGEHVDWQINTQSAAQQAAGHRHGSAGPGRFCHHPHPERSACSSLTCTAWARASVKGSPCAWPTSMPSVPACRLEIPRSTATALCPCPQQPCMGSTRIHMRSGALSISLTRRWHNSDRRSPLA